MESKGNNNIQEDLVPTGTRLGIITNSKAHGIAEEVSLNVMTVLSIAGSKLFDQSVLVYTGYNLCRLVALAFPSQISYVEDGNIHKLGTEYYFLANGYNI